MKPSFTVRTARPEDHSRAALGRQMHAPAQWKGKNPVCGLRHDYVSGERHNLEADCQVTADRSHGPSVWVIRSGILRLQRHSFDGRRQILSLFLPGEIVGYDQHLRDGMSVESGSWCCLFRIDRREFEARMERDEDLRKEVYGQHWDQIERLHWLTASIGALRPEERVSAFLALATRFMPYQPLPDGSGVLTILLSRADIADLLATATETISRITHSLEEAGVIEIRDPSHFRITDLRRLTQIGRIEASFAMMPFRPRQVVDRHFVRPPVAGICAFAEGC
jgi:CRP-like cAMP-binding protein